MAVTALHGSGGHGGWGLSGRHVEESYSEICVSSNIDFSIFKRLLRPSRKRRLCLRYQTNPKTQVPSALLSITPRTLPLGAHFQDSKNPSAPFVTWLLCWQTSCWENKGAAPHHVHPISPFHSDQAAREERTYRKTDGPAPNTRQNSLEGPGAGEGTG